VNNRRNTLIAAVVLALITGVIALSYFSKLQQQAIAARPPTVPLRAVVIANQSIPARAKITKEMLIVKQIPEDKISDPDTISDPALAAGNIAQVTIPDKVPVTQSRIAKAADVGFQSDLKPGMRAVSISMDRVRGVSGLVEPGDYVDIIAIPPRAGTSAPKAATIMRDVLVLAINSTTESAGGTPSPDIQNVSSVTLQVTPTQAADIAMADANAALHLALRSPKDKDKSLPIERLSYGDQSRQPQAAAPPAAPPAAAPAAPAAPVAPVAAKPVEKTQPERPSVTVIDGDTVTSSGSKGK